MWWMGCDVMIEIYSNSVTGGVQHVSIISQWPNYHWLEYSYSHICNIVSIGRFTTDPSYPNQANKSFPSNHSNASCVGWKADSYIWSVLGTFIWKMKVKHSTKIKKAGTFLARLYQKTYHTYHPSPPLQCFEFSSCSMFLVLPSFP